MDTRTKEILDAIKVVESGIDYIKLWLNTSKEKDVQILHTLEYLLDNLSRLSEKLNPDFSDIDLSGLSDVLDKLYPETVENPETVEKIQSHVGHIHGNASFDDCLIDALQRYGDGTVQINDNELDVYIDHAIESLGDNDGVIEYTIAYKKGDALEKIYTPKIKKLNKDELRKFILDHFSLDDDTLFITYRSDLGETAKCFHIFKWKGA